MIKFQLIDTQHPEYGFVENLLETAFPVEERRDLPEQRIITDKNGKFSCYLIQDEQAESIGFITVWNLDGFHYVEHLATSANIRNKGYGKEIMQKLTEMLPDETIILEVERPDNEMSCRRIGFYKRCGFSLCEKNYIQPAYRTGGEEVPLFLMYIHTESIDRCFDNICEKLYKEVYGLTPSRRTI